MRVCGCVCVLCCVVCVSVACYKFVLLLGVLRRQVHRVRKFEHSSLPYLL